MSAATDTCEIHLEERSMTDETPAPRTDPNQEAEDSLAGARAYFEEALKSGDPDDRWKAMTSLEIATQGHSLAQLTSRIQALEELVHVLLSDQPDDLQQQIRA